MDVNIWKMHGQAKSALSFHWLPKGSNCASPYQKHAREYIYSPATFCILKYRTVMEKNYTENCLAKKKIAV